MEKMRLTLAFIQKMKPGSGVRIADTEVPGLQVRAMAQSISFYIRKKHDGVMYESLIGKFPAMTLDEARRIALDKLGAIANYRDINAPSGRMDPLIRDACEFYIENSKSARWAKQALSKFDCIADRKIKTVSKIEIQQIFLSLKDTPVMANAAVRCLSAAINKLAKSLCIDIPNPAAGIKLNPVAPRTRTISEKEAPRIIAQLQTMAKTPFYREQAEAILLMLYTGQRKSRVLGIHISQIDCEYKIWHVPGNDIKRPVELALNDESWEIIAPRIGRFKSGFIFERNGAPLQDVRKTFATACKAIGAENLTIHDLRRSLGTWMLSSGASIEEVSKTLGHSSIRVTEQVYAHLLSSKGRRSTSVAIQAMKTGKIN